MMVLPGGRIYFFGILTGLRTILKGNVIIGLKRILLPVAYWRLPVFSLVLDRLANDLNGQKVLKTLDIGSPKLLALYLAVKYDVTVSATDLQDKAIWYMWQTYFDCWNPSSAKGAYITEYQDGRKLTYPDESFDIVYSISVLEHIPDNGDSVTMQEISRVLRKGGKAIIEVPYALKGHDTFLEQNVYERRYNGQAVFYERHYDDATLAERIIKPAHLKLVQKVVIGERLPFERFWNKTPNFIKFPLSWTEGIVSSLNHFRMNEKKIKKDIAVSKKRAMSVALVFRKE